MNYNEQELLKLVTEYVSKNPRLISKVIDAATEGVKTFADGQADRSY